MDLLTREFLIDSVVIVASFLIRAFESENPRMVVEQEAEELKYEESEDFNEFWDDSFGEFEMGDYSFTASEILFNSDKQAYLNERNAFTEIETTDE